MIQMKRGSTSSWKSRKVILADGQPGYDKDRKKLKVGDGKHTWDELPDASGLRLDEILDSEENAKKKAKSKGIIGSFIARLLNLDDRPVITYGPDSPDEDTIGQVYLQHYDAEPEADYVTAFYMQNGWTCKKWKSGFASCAISISVNTSIQTEIDETCIYHNTTTIAPIQYPFTFDHVPNEIASIASSGGLVWLGASKALNTETTSATYSILSADKLSNSAEYRVSIKVEGFLKST